MRFTILGAMLFFVLGQGRVSSQEKEETLLHLGNLKLGQKGKLNDKQTNIDFNYILLVDQVLSENEVLIRDRVTVNVPKSKNFGKETGPAHRAIIQIPTKGLVDNARFDPKETIFEVIDTKKIGMATYFLLRPVKEKK